MGGLDQPRRVGSRRASWLAPTRRLRAHRACGASRRVTLDDIATYAPNRPKALMKIVLWIIFIIFLIGLAVVLGLGKLIF